MGRVFLTGDTHGDMDIYKIRQFDTFIGKELTRDDVVIILGDWGGIWFDNKKDKSIIDFWKNKNWTTFIVAGNHENYDAIEKLPIVEVFGNKCYKVEDNIIIGITGKEYKINGFTFFNVNGADSQDIYDTDGKLYRQKGINWWIQEQIKQEVVEEVLNKNIEVDFLITHTGGEEVCKYLGFKPTISDIRLTQIMNHIQYKKHFCGHYHKDICIDNTLIMYKRIIELPFI